MIKCDCYGNVTTASIPFEESADVARRGHGRCAHPIQLQELLSFDSSFDSHAHIVRSLQRFSLRAYIPGISLHCDTAVSAWFGLGLGLP